MSSSDRPRPFCVSPFVRAYVLPDGSFRDCCATHPYLQSQPGQDFSQWWYQDARLQDLRQQMQKADFPTSCQSCRVQDSSNNSLRQAINRNNPDVLLGQHPREWSIMFGNVCNLACWTCSELFSSTIAAQKKRIGILPADYVDSQQSFMSRWDQLRLDIMRSYEQHDRVTLSLLGGEPSYNPVVREFLKEIYQAGLAPRTRIELTTNGTKTNNEFFDLITDPAWLSLSVFVSVDAIGAKAEWLRYGCQWKDVQKNIDAYIQAAYRVEIHTVVSVLNIRDLPAVHDFAHDRKVLFTPFPLRMPDQLNLAYWDGPPLIDDEQVYREKDLGEYVDLIGSQKMPGTRHRLVHYLENFRGIRTHLETADPDLYQRIKGD
jgi:sulfatase maturation enzyme AslB (radical SAM superfamily)